MPFRQLKLTGQIIVKFATIVADVAWDWACSAISNATEL
jgi:hypothetical protein